MSHAEDLNKEIAKLAQTIGARYLEVLHHDVDSTINQEARRGLMVYATELLKKLQELKDDQEG